MKVISLSQKYDVPVVMCLGFFDCMHSGHTRLLNEAKRIALLCGAQVALFTFSNNHFDTLNRPVKLIYTFSERLELYRSLGVDVVVEARFDAEFMLKTGKEFLREITDNFNLKGIVCGCDFTCGSDLTGALDVQKFFEGVCPVKIASLVKTAFRKKVSSTFIRSLLSDGKVRRANGYLSQPFFFCGTVARGRRVGHELGFPTANLEIPADKLAPAGVFLGLAAVDGTTYKAVVNVGNTPTFALETPRVEAHLLDFDGDLYGKPLKVCLLKYIRPIQKFDSEQALKHQLQRDISHWRRR
ncbi:MAG: riboflavin biosynthesis protein RibF [Corallococcus sp.]|nr:riboflavin biosynthesis protein RibF [Corallococcus sp.]MCM1359720.1 riboflavin biosynthesis protein RibF [Corallococcus sp.]MCM1395429.1 riboflavin biosynthesis protein RibF [Corallococcus sp.]